MPDLSVQQGIAIKDMLHMSYHGTCMVHFVMTLWQVSSTYPLIDIVFLAGVQVHAVLSSSLYVVLSCQCSAAPETCGIHESTALTYARQLIFQDTMASFVEKTQ